MLPSGEKGAYQLPNTIATVEQMVRAVLPDFGLDSATHDVPFRTSRQNQPTVAEVRDPVNGTPEESALYPSMPFGFDVNGRLPGDVPLATMPEEQVDFTAADMGWDIDFGTMDMDAFLSIDPSQTYGFRT